MINTCEEFLDDSEEHILEEKQGEYIKSKIMHENYF